MRDATESRLGAVATTTETPAYVYFVDVIADQIAAVQRVFGHWFKISYAIKSNPNIAVLREIGARVPFLDASSSGEIDRAILAGFSPGVVSFSGPGKRDFELERAVQVGCGEIVCESEWDLDRLQRIADRDRRNIAVLLRLNPARLPAKFGAQMGGRASQFGIDEESVDEILGAWNRWPALVCEGFHVYSGSNSLSVEGIAENFGIAFELFGRCAARHRLQPKKLIVGAGFGIPYHQPQQALDLEALGRLVTPVLHAAQASEGIKGAVLVLEMGRYLVGPAGYLLTRVVNIKESRGTRIAVCDAGFNNHLAACGMMGAVIRRNWPITKVAGNLEAEAVEHTIVGPLCTSIDTLASNIVLPRLERGDVIAVGSSGAYGLSASPTRFISHPEPREVLVPQHWRLSELRDVSESPTFVSTAVLTPPTDAE